MSLETLHCPVAAQCGGCPLIDLSVSDGRAQKLASVHALLEQALSSEDLAALTLTFHEARSERHYRNRLRLRVFADGSFGFFNEHKSAACAVLELPLRDRLQALHQQLAPFAEQLKHFDYLELRTADLQGQAGLYLGVLPQRSVAGAASPIAMHRGEQTVTREPQMRSSAEKIRDALCKTQLLIAAECLGDEAWPSQKYALSTNDDSTPCFMRVPVGAFMQVNSGINQALVTEVRRLAQEAQVSRALDLYCGSGNFLLPLLACGIQGEGVELNQRAIEAARHASEEQGFNATWTAMDASAFISQRPPGCDDLVIVDPPRAGLRDGVSDLVKLQASFLAMCSCNPQTMARDLAALCEAGYAPVSVTLFDMFAFTGHVEILVWMKRKNL